jgi:hypothetical protein
MKTKRRQSHLAFSVASLLALIAAGHMGVAVAQAPTKVPSGDPCTVVPLSDVQKAFPGAKPGERSTRSEKYGITECAWKDGSGVVVFGVQEFYGNHSAMEEARGLGQAMVEGKTANERNVRYEVLTGTRQWLSSKVATTSVASSSKAPCWRCTAASGRCC